MVNDDSLLCTICKRIVKGFAEGIEAITDDAHDSSLNDNGSSNHSTGVAHSNGSSSGGNTNSDSDNSSLSSFDERVGIYGFEREVCVNSFSYLGLLWTKIYN